MIASDANAAYSGLEDGSNSLFDAEKGVFDGKRIDGEIAKVGDAMLGERIHVQDGVPRANDGGLDADVAGAEARAGAIGGATVDRDADESDLELFGLRDVRETHESGDAGKAGIAESIERLRMRQAKGTSGFRHGEAY
jgi:hypothetical protein